MHHCMLLILPLFAMFMVAAAAVSCWGIIIWGRWILQVWLSSAKIKATFCVRVVETISTSTSTSAAIYIYL